MAETIAWAQRPDAFVVTNRGVDRTPIGSRNRRTPRADVISASVPRGGLCVYPALAWMSALSPSA